MPKPTIIVEAAFGAAPYVEPAAWTRLDTTGNGCRRLTKRHGRRTRYLPLPPAEVVLELSNKNGNLDPANTASPYYPNVRRDTPIRVRLDTAGTGAPINLLTMDQARFVGPAVAGWENNQRAGLTTTTEEIGGLGDERSLRVINNSGTIGLLSIRTPGLVTGITGGQAHTFMYRTLAATTGRDRSIFVEWYTAADVLISSNFSGNLGVSNTARWSEVAFTTTAPATAAKAKLFLDVAATSNANEVHYVSRVSVARGARAPWTIPGGIYDICRGYALDWDARYSPDLNDSTCTLVAQDLSRLLAEHQLWPTVAEHELLDGFLGTPPTHYYALDDEPNQPGADYLDTARSGITPADLFAGDIVRGTDRRLPLDGRPFAKFAAPNDETDSRILLKNPNKLISPWGDAWGLECAFMTRQASVSQTVIVVIGVVELRILASRLYADVGYTNGTVDTRDTGALSVVAGQTHVVQLFVNETGTFFLYLDGVFKASNSGGGRTPVTPSTVDNFRLGRREDNTRELVGEVGRLAIFDSTNTPAANHATPYWNSLQDAWGFHNTVGERAAYLLDEFRHKLDVLGSIPGTYPGLPPAWYHVDNPSAVAVRAMEPDGRSVLGYLQSLEATESGLLKVKAGGVLRLRGRDTVPPKPGATLTNSLGAGAVPVRGATPGRSPDTVSVVKYKTTAQTSERTATDATALAAHGDVSVTLPNLESDTVALAEQAAADVLAVNAPDRWRADDVYVTPDDPAVGWGVVMAEPGDRVRLDVALPFYTHDKPYELLDVNLDLAPAGSKVTFGMVSDA